MKAKQDRELLSSINAELEALVIGTILQDGESAYSQVDFLGPDDFGVDIHRTIFCTILEIACEVDLTIGAVTHRLIEAGKLEAVGGMTKIVDLDAKGISGIALAGFGRSLRSKAIGRRAYRVISKLTASLELGFTANGDELRGTAEELLALTEDSGGCGPTVPSIEDLPAVSASLEPIRYISEPELPEGAVIALTGDSGSGKSTVATAWVRNAIAVGRAALILDRENPRSVVMDRMKRLGLVDGPLLRWAGGWTGQDAPGPDSPLVVNWGKACDPKPIVVIDSLVAFLGGADENSATEMRKFMNGARRLADLGATVIQIHHDGKAETARDFRGSSDFKASVDQAFHVTNISSDGKLDRIRLRCFKSRYGFSGDVIYRYAEGRLIRDERADAPARTTGEDLTAILRQHPGIKAGEFEKKAVTRGSGRNQAREFLSNGVLGGLIRQEPAGKNAKKYYLVGRTDE